MKFNEGLKSPLMYFFLAGAIALGFAACNDSVSPAVAPPAQPGQVPCLSTTASVGIPQNAATLGTAGFGVNPLIVPVGAVVTWTNDDTVNHTVTSEDGSFSSMIIPPGGTFEVTFDSEGVFPYFCAVFGKTAMSGEVKVVPQLAGCPGASPSATPSESPTPTPSVEPSLTPSPTPSSTPSVSPSVSPSGLPSGIPVF